MLLSFNIWQQCLVPYKGSFWSRYIDAIQHLFSCFICKAMSTTFRAMNTPKFQYTSATAEIHSTAIIGILSPSPSTAYSNTNYHLLHTASGYPILNTTPRYSATSSLSYGMNDTNATSTPPATGKLSFHSLQPKPLVCEAHPISCVV